MVSFRLLGGGAERRGGLRLNARRRGVALLNAMFFMAVMTIMLVTGISFTQSSFKAAREVKYDTQVYNVARAGLVDAINYFKRQPDQPVIDFDPEFDPANPKGDSFDPYRIDPGKAGEQSDKGHLGIVQEWEIDERQNLWARYEVGKVTKLEKDAKGELRTYSIMERSQGAWVKKTVDQAKSDEWEGVQDVSRNYGLEGRGLIWRIRSHGYIYKRDPSASAGTWFFQYPNQVIAQLELETEIRRLQLEDYLGGVVGDDATGIVFNNIPKVKVVAPLGYAVVFNDNWPTPFSEPSSFSGDLGKYHLSRPKRNDLSWYGAFGVSDAQTLASLADVTVTSVGQLPEKMSTMALTYIKPATGTAVFTQSRPLNGGGILVVDGHLTLATSSASTFAGYIYVTGNYEQNSPSLVSGQIVVRGKITMNSPTDTANVEYNKDFINEIRKQLGQYRERRSAQRPVED